MKGLQRLIQGLYFITFIFTTFLLVSYVENNMQVPNIVIVIYILSAELSFAKILYVNNKKPVRR